jgi:hypothetical protein
LFETDTQASLQDGLFGENKLKSKIFFRLYGTLK